jgi:UDP-N-acetylmuramoyl-L-alanyl-D-glutamate--2,6-diaminopimelate ligase
MLDTFLANMKRFIPVSVFTFFSSPYYAMLAFVGAVIYRFPSRNIKVIAITGTKGKSSTVEILNAILEEAGYTTALTNTIRFKINNESRENKYKMSMPGRFFMQQFLRNAVRAGCDYAILEMTSQGAIAYRHRFIELDAFVMTNISPEHIESHGSYENYVSAKLSLVRDGIGRSGKSNRTIIVNADDKESDQFLNCVERVTRGAEAGTTKTAVKKITYSLQNGEPYEIKKEGLAFTLHGARRNVQITSPLSGLFNLYNILAAATTAQSQGVSDEVIARAVEKFNGIPGRVEKIKIKNESGGRNQDFQVVVDYAHTPDSLEKLYRVFRPDPKTNRAHESKIIAILGGTGGGRDTWKRGKMGSIADTYCDEIILTDEDPYDENPQKIVDEVARGITSKKPTIIMDRRTAIATATRRAQKNDIILITGKGTDPYIMGPRGSKTPWSDAQIAREELEKALSVPDPLGL